MTDKNLIPKLKSLQTYDATEWESAEKLIISLDFGTTYSGIAFCFASQRDAKVEAIMNWPGGTTAPKIPTLINYNSGNAAGGGGFTWGAAADGKTGNIVGLKLLLDPKQELPLYLPTGSIKKGLRKLPKPAVDVTSDFLFAMYKHALTEIARKVPEGYMAICQKEFVLSVPAVWSDAAKDATVQAAKRAGLSPVTLIKGPEAAALYTLHSLDVALEVGDAFVVCDAGASIVDLISYEVEEVCPQLKVKELVPGNGLRAGSLSLNQRFAEAVSNLVGDDQWYTLKKSRGFTLAEKQFDREVKKAFLGDPKEEYFVNFPMTNLEDDPDENLENSTWCMTAHDIEEIFKPLVSDILRLISDQVKSVQIKRPQARVAGIFLAGGFGSSQFLKTCVEKANPGVKVLQPSDAWTAIVKGAALSKLPQAASVMSTLATKHYGVEARYEFDDDEDQGTTTVIDRYTGEKRVHKEYPEDYAPYDLLFTDYLCKCSDPAAPRHRSKGQMIGLNCALTADLQDVPVSRFTKKTFKGGGR